MDPTVSEYSSEFKAPLPSTYSEDISGIRAPLPSTWEDSGSDSSEAAVPPTEDKGKGKATTPPAVDEDQTMEPLAPVMSYEPGSDHLDLPSDEEPKYEGKGKGRCTHSRNATSAIRQADIHAQLRVSLTSQARANRHLPQLQALGQPAMFRTTWHPVRLRPRGQPARLRTAQDPARQCQPSKFRTAQVPARQSQPAKFRTTQDPARQGQAHQGQARPRPPNQSAKLKPIQSPLGLIATHLSQKKRRNLRPLPLRTTRKLLLLKARTQLRAAQEPSNLTIKSHSRTRLEHMNVTAETSMTTLAKSVNKLA